MEATLVISGQDTDAAVAGRPTCYVQSTEVEQISSLPAQVARDITIIPRLNDVRYFNKYLKAVNAKLPEGGLLVACIETSELLREQLFRKHDGWLAQLLYLNLFICHRVLPKLILTKKAYFAITKGRHRVLSRAELLGRLVFCGFEIVEQRVICGEFYVVARKMNVPNDHPSPSYGMIFNMKRVGEEGKVIFVHKLRTMHPYAEFLQEYVYARNNLDASGKIREDFRVASWGFWMRRFWIDELPMLLNLIRGDLKLVGVRPLSEHYFSLYPDDFAEVRRRHKPGLLPPYYADLPQGFDGIVESEARYLAEYEARPIATDFKYFCRIVLNMIRGARSK